MDKFQAALEGSDVIFIVGTGVSAAVTDNAPTATWAGLIRNGVDEACAIDPTLDATWRGLASGLLDYGASDRDSAAFIQAGGMVSKALKSIGDQEYRRWLESAVGELPLVNRDVAQALLAYPFPILTTNYDTLLEKTGHRQSAYWSDPRPFHEVLTRRSDAIGHIHGVWDRPDSVILSESDYARLSHHESTVALERAMSALKSIVYVGFGSGLEDPNFSALFEWQRKILPDSPVIHFRLCKEDEESEVRRAHGSDNVVPVVYGSNHSDLAPFLKSHLPNKAILTINDAGLARDVVQEAREELAESMSADSVLLEAGVDKTKQDRLVVPPVLLPLPHAMYVRERLRTASRSGQEIAPFDPLAEVKSHDLMVVVGDEGAGLSTAVKWLACESSKFLGSAAPIYIPFAQCQGKKPLTAATAKAAMALGLIRGRRNEIPVHILALDDYNPSVRGVAEAVLSEFISSTAIVKILGCRQGDEDEVVAQLRSAGLNPRVQYLGRMRSSDVRTLANLISPGQGEKIADEVAKVLDLEGLRKTPLTVSILIYLVYRGVSDPGSQASIIDSYVHLLLVLGDPHIAQPPLAEGDLEAILAHLAEYMTWEERSALSEPETISAISDVISKYGWPAHATEVLTYLKSRRILRVESGLVSFARSAYLFLFAARRAVSDAQFRELIYGDPFYYQPVVTRYAALLKTDAALLDHMGPVLDAALLDSVETTSPYGAVPLVLVDEAPTASPSEDQAVEASEGSDAPEIELPELSGNVSFGLVRSDMSIANRLSRSLTLVSGVLRDLDQVENLGTKQQMLVDTLELWGRYVTALGVDAAMQAFSESMAEYLEKRETNPKRRERALEYFSKAFPAGSALGLMEMSLVSSKLVPILMKALRAGLLTTTPEKRTATIFFLVLQKPEGWVGLVRDLVEDAEPTWLLTEFVHGLCQQEYFRASKEDPDLLQLCLHLEQADKSYATPALQGQHLSKYERTLNIARAKHLATGRSSDKKALGA